jgi:GNAT superfamily N-acetyltransferase
MINIINATECPNGIENAITYIHSKWGGESNFAFYDDAIRHSSLPGKTLPKFFVMIKNNRITGCVGLIINDFISRHDLWPWLCCLYVDEQERGNEYGKHLIAHAVNIAQIDGFNTVYLTTGLDGYYERYGWTRIEDGISFDGSSTRIYKMTI